jgi:hypothetical protein
MALTRGFTDMIIDRTTGKKLSEKLTDLTLSLSDIAPLKPSGDTTGEKDTTAIQNAINTNGKAVLSAGNFYITSLSLNGIQGIIGSMVNQTIINTVATSGYGISILPTAQKCELRYFNLTSTYTGCGGISFNDISVSPSYDTRHFMENVRISNMVGTSLYVGQYTREGRFLNVHTNGSREHGVFINGTDSFFNNMTTNSVYKCGFYLGTASANNNFVNCKAFLCGGSTDNTLTEPFRSGFYVSGSGLNVLTGCESQQNYGGGFYIDSPFNSVNGVLVDGNGYMGTYTSNGIYVNSAGNTIVANIQNPPLQGALTNFVYLSSSAVRNSLLITANENTAQQLAYMGTTGYTTVSSNTYGEESANPGNYVVINGEQYGNYPLSDLFATYNSTKSLNNFGGTDTATYNSPTNEYTFSLTSATTTDARVQFTIPQGTGTGDLSQYKYLYMTATVKCGDVTRFFYPSLQCYAQVNSGSWIYLNAVSFSGLKNSISTNYMKVIAVFDLTHVATPPYTWNNLFPSIAAVKRTAITDGQTHNVFIKDAKFYLSK